MTKKSSTTGEMYEPVNFLDIGGTSLLIIGNFSSRKIKPAKKGVPFNNCDALFQSVEFLKNNESLLVSATTIQSQTNGHRWLKDRGFTSTRNPCVKTQSRLNKVRQWGRSITLADLGKWLNFSEKDFASMRELKVPEFYTDANNTPLVFTHSLRYGQERISWNSAGGQTYDSFSQADLDGLKRYSPTSSEIKNKKHKGVSW